MQIRVLGSSSAGNGYVVSDGRTALLVEAGIRFADVQRGLGFRVAGLSGCLVSHEHGDHARSVRELVRAGVDVYASRGTLEALGLEGHRLHPVRALEQFRLGTWTILPFDSVHDAAEPLGFLLSSGSSGREKLVYLTDSAYCRYRFRGLTHMMVEANYALDLLRRNAEEGVIDPSLARRILRTHMGIERTLDFLRANDLSRVEEIWLLHLSDQNSDAELFRRLAQEATGKPVYVADKMAFEGKVVGAYGR